MSDEIANLKHALAVANNWVQHHQNHCDDLIKENAALRESLAIEQERSLYWRNIANQKEPQP